MGCDIHAYPEYLEFDRWWSIGGDINPGRDYSVFTELAGVRGSSETALEPKGIPSDLGFAAYGDYWLYIVEKEDLDPCTCTKENAERWVNCKVSRYYNEEKRRVSDPDAHNASWVTLEEFKKCIENAELVSPIYYGLAAMLEEIEVRGFKTRLVFWFDN